MIWCNKGKGFEVLKDAAMPITAVKDAIIKTNPIMAATKIKNERNSQAKSIQSARTTKVQNSPSKGMESAGNAGGGRTLLGGGG